MSASSASRRGSTTTDQIHATAGLGQGRDCLGLFGEDRITIPKLPWRARDCEKSATAALDPLQANGALGLAHLGPMASGLLARATSAEVEIGKTTGQPF